jgi:hypothetical protein
MTSTRRLLRLTRFSRLVIVLMVIFTLLTMIPIAIGRARNDSDDLQALGFWVCDGKPCFMGITPGITTWDDAITIVGGHKNAVLQDKDWIIVRLVDKAFIDMGIRRHPGGEKVSDASLLLWVDQEPYFPKLGAFVRMYGPPTCVRVIMIESMIENVVLLFPGLSLTITPDGERITPNSSLGSVTLERNEGITRTCGSREDDSSIRTSHWSGFVSINRYVP